MKLIVRLCAKKLIDFDNFSYDAESIETRSFRDLREFTRLKLDSSRQKINKPVQRKWKNF